MSSTREVFLALMRTIEQRRLEMPPESYTTRLLAGGTARIGEKVMEEAAELVEAAVQLDQVRGESLKRTGEGPTPDKEQVVPSDGPLEAARSHLVYEAGDLIYHMFVLLAHHDVELDAVAEELARRFGTSGLAEKASRRKPDPGRTADGQSKSDN